MWSADVDARVLLVAARATTAPDATDIRRFDPRVVRDIDGEHVRFIVHGEVFRLDIVSGTVLSGPVHLTYLLAQDGRLARQMDTIRRLEHGLAGTEPGQIEGASRIVRSAMALRARDARAAGASLREIATELLGAGEWPGPGEYRKSAIRRLVSMGESLVRQGPLPILTW
jgi:hypothetical protein